MESPKHFYLSGSENPANPGLLFEVRLEVLDVRSRFSGSESGFFKGPIVEDVDLDWTRDMVSSVDPMRLVEFQPPGSVKWPINAEAQITQYFLRFHRGLIWRNRSLNLYSEAGESRDDFLLRCLSVLLEERALALTNVRDVFLRRFLEIEQRKLDSIIDDDWSEESSDQRVVEVKDIFSRIRDAFSRCFLRDDLKPLSENDLLWTVSSDVEYEERLRDLRAEFVDSFNEVNKSFQLRLSQIEEYEIPLSHSQIEASPIGILWT